MPEVNKGTTSYQCPDCGQPRTGEECRVCDFIERERAREIPEIPWDGNSKMRPPPVVLAFDFQKARAEKAEKEVNCLRGAIEKHRENENQQRGIHPLAHLDRDIELWAALEPPGGPP